MTYLELHDSYGSLCVKLAKSSRPQSFSQVIVDIVPKLCDCFWRRWELIAPQILHLVFQSIVCAKLKVL